MKIGVFGKQRTKLYGALTLHTDSVRVVLAINMPND